MKKLSDYKGQKIAIHFPTYELWLRRKEINSSDELEDKNWFTEQSETCCSPNNRNGKGQFCYKDWYIEQGYTILAATDFLEDEFIYGQEYEFSDDEEFRLRFTRHYIAKTPCGKFIGYDKEEEVAISWKYCRKINTERTEAITTAKELITKFDIKQAELFNN